MSEQVTPPTEPEVNNVQETSPPPGIKVYVGNIDFATTEDNLNELFGDAGKVENVQIISRGNRSLGYGFVTYATQEEAESAVSKFHQHKFNDRAINVELARPTQPNGDAEGGEPKSRGTRGRARGRGRGRFRGRSRGRGGRFRGRGRPRTRGTKARSADGAEDENTDGQEGEDNENKEEEEDSDEQKPRSRSISRGRGRGRGRGRRGRGRGRGGFRPRRSGPPQGEPSKTLVFVANIPFHIDDEGLKGLFEGLNVVSAHIVRSTRGPSEGKSKGFGFVELSSEEEQQKAMELLDKKELEGRQIQVKVGIAPPATDSEENNEEENSKSNNNTEENKEEANQQAAASA